MSFFDDHRPHTGLTYAAYVDLMAEQAAAAPPADDAEAAEKIEYTKLNLHRSGRISRTWRPSEELAALAARLEPQLWMVLTEPWCGDSAQCLPCLAVLADAVNNIDLRLLLRDDTLYFVLPTSDGVELASRPRGTTDAKRLGDFRIPERDPGESVRGGNCVSFKPNLRAWRHVRWDREGLVYWNGKQWTRIAWPPAPPKKS